MAILVLSGFSPAMAASDGLFHSKETISGNLKYFTKWNDMIDHYKHDSSGTESSECGKDNRRCNIQKWQNFLSEISGKSRKEQLAAVQKYANEAEYIIDPINWGVEDYWATPKQFFIKDGDCEDYAIAKFMSLRKLGFKNEDMRVVVLNDTNLKALHSVLVVYMDNEEWILDNQISPVVTSSQIHHYQPIYSINETNWWMHTS